MRSEILRMLKDLFQPFIIAYGKLRKRGLPWLLLELPEMFRKVLLGWGFIALAAILAFTVFAALKTEDLVIDEIGLPKNIKELGYSEQASAMALREQMLNIIREAQTGTGHLTIKTQFDQQDISVPVAGLSLDTAIRFIRQALGRQQRRLIGDIVCTAEPCTMKTLELRMRMIDRNQPPRALAPVRGSTPDAILASGAETIMRAEDPISLAMFLFGTKDNQTRRAESVALAREMIEAGDPQQHQALNLLGIEAMERQNAGPADMEQALAFFQAAMEADASYGLAYVNATAALNNLARNDLAVAEGRKAVALLPGVALAHHNLGAALSDAGQFDEAVKELAKAIELNPQEPDTWMALGQAHLRNKKPDLAKAAYEGGMKLNPGGTRILVNWAGNLFKAEDFNGVAEKASAIVELTPEDPVGYALWGEALNSLGKKEEAIAKLLKATEVSPGYAAAYYDLGSVYATIEKPVEAATALETYLRLSPDAADKQEVENWVMELRSTGAQ